MKINQNNPGLLAENIAARYLIEQGLTMLAKNYHCRFGEIDLIMQDQSTLVFIEVRLRSSLGFGNAGSSITKQKQLKLTRTALHYLQAHGDAACRFDAILMDKADVANLVWLRNAFDA
jgi:putative endonuclease